jgi:hypothetical protein
MQAAFTRKPFKRKLLSNVSRLSNEGALKFKLLHAQAAQASRFKRKLLSNVSRLRTQAAFK